MSLEDLEKRVALDLAKVDFPPKPWRFEEEGILDVAIVGAGMAGLCAAFALLKQGISKIQLFDENPPGKEGPWITFARMVTLRSPKSWMGPALGIPSLTLHSWYEAKYGNEAWESFNKVSREEWMEYLCWYRKVLKLQVQNHSKLLSITPHKGHLQLHFTKGVLLAQKVVLATGRSGFGGAEIPEFMHKVPKDEWAHTNEIIDFPTLKGKRIAVLGGGDSALDAARMSLLHGAKSADVFIRRTKPPNTNPARELFFQGCYAGYYELPDAQKWEIVRHIIEKGITAPKETLHRISELEHFHYHTNIDFVKVLGQYDFYILGTGLAVDGAKQPELKPLMGDILLWNDRGFTSPAKMGRFPYLGPHFEFLEKEKGSAPFLKNIYCFNYGGYLSHSLLSIEIPPISYGAERLAMGISADFFLKDQNKHMRKFKDYNDPEFNYDDFSFFK